MKADTIIVDMNVYKESIISTAALLNERQKRLFLGNQARMLGRGGITLISNLSGADRDTVASGVKEAEALKNTDSSSADYLKIKNLEGTTVHGMQRVRKEGAGRKSIEENQPGIVDALLKIIKNDHNYGDPEGRILEWISKSTRNISDAMREEGYVISHAKVGELLRKEGYSLQENRKLKQVGSQHADRDKQFQYINETANAYMNDGEPVISVDCKKKENVGNYKNDGRTYCEKGKPVAVLDHDFPDPENGKAAPYGIYDISRNDGFVNVGVSADTAEFAVESIRRWWNEMGSISYPSAKRLYITADGGGSNGSRCRLWKVELAKLAKEVGFPIEVSHFPPGTSKWNKIEHRMFSFISRNWRGKPLETVAVIVSLIGATKTKPGLTIKCMADGTHYETGITIPKEIVDGLSIVYNDFHSDWNYTVMPN